jgi:hypothetical protein
LSLEKENKKDIPKVDSDKNIITTSVDNSKKEWWLKK